MVEIDILPPLLPPPHPGSGGASRSRAAAEFAGRLTFDRRERGADLDLTEPGRAAGSELIARALAFRAQYLAQGIAASGLYLDPSLHSHPGFAAYRSPPTTAQAGTAVDLAV